MPSVDIPGRITAVEYSDDAVNIQSVSPGTSGAPSQISRDGVLTVVIVQSPTTSSYVELPSDGEVGDVVEVHGNSGASANIVAPSGESLELQASSVPTPAVFRKIGATLWGAVKGA